MNEEEQKRDEMESLSDGILFLGVNQAVSGAASYFCWDKGNPIFYVRSHCSSLGSEFVFDLETGTNNPVKSCPAYCNLFWPPPQWVTSRWMSSSASEESEYISLEADLTSPPTVISSTEEIGYNHPEFGLITSTTVTCAGKEVGSSGSSSPSSKCSFKCSGSNLLSSLSLASYK